MRSFFDRHPVARKLAASLVICSAFLSPVAGATIALASPTANTAAPTPEGAQQTQQQSAQTRQPAGQAQQQKPQRQDQKTDTQGANQGTDPEQYNTINMAKERADIVNNGLGFAEGWIKEGINAKGAEEGTKMCIYMMSSRRDDAKDFCASDVGKAAAVVYLSCLDAGKERAFCAGLAFSEKGLKTAAARIEESGGWEDFLHHPFDSIKNYVMQNPGEAALNVALLVLTFTPLGLPARAVQILTKIPAAGRAIGAAFNGVKWVGSKIPFMGFTKEGLTEAAEDASLREASSLVADGGGESVGGWTGIRTSITNKIKGDTAAEMKESYADGFLKGIEDIAAKGKRAADEEYTATKKQFDEVISKAESLEQDLVGKQDQKSTLEKLLKNDYPKETKKNLQAQLDNIKQEESQLSRLREQASEYDNTMRDIDYDRNSYEDLAQTASKYTRNPAAKTSADFKEDLFDMKRNLSEDELESATRAAEKASESARYRWGDTFQKTKLTRTPLPAAGSGFDVLSEVADNNVENDKIYK